MERETAFLSSFSGYMRLRPGPGLRDRVRRAAQAAADTPRDALSPAGIWIEDHARFLLDEAERLIRDTRFSPRLPACGGTPRALRWAREICRRGEGEISASLILRVVREAPDGAEITQRELHALPAALSCAVFESLSPLLEGCCRESDLQRKAEAWAGEIAAGKREDLPRDPALLFRVRQSAAFQDAPENRAQTAPFGQDEEEAIRRLQKRWTEEGLLAGRLITSLHRLQEIPFDRIGERLSPAAAALREDGVYSRMDAESREDYRQCACRIARRLGVSEASAARAAVALAAGKTGVEGQAGYYLKECPDLIGVYLMKRKKPSFALRNREGLFLLALYGGTAAGLFFAALLGVPWYLWGCAALCVSQIVRQLAYRIVRKAFPAWLLPRIALKKLDEKRRTLAVVPALLTSRPQALRMMRQLAVLRKANPDAFLDFMLLADFADSREESLPEDEEILLAAKSALDALNRQEGGGYYYLHRARKWDMGQSRFTGRERKRGALEALNHLLAEGECRDHFLYMSTEPKALKGRYQYVITLDADTFLPPGAACQLVGAMEHPLQKGRVAVIQPRMEVGADTVRTRAQKLFGGRGGVDPYHLAVQDAYQDLFGQGSFVGKGIYDPVLFLKKTEGRFPAGRLLSHDLIEGETAGSALAEDIVCYDGHPAALSGWQKRLHRWTRGDWQLLPFLWDRRLKMLSRHKIWDNLRRSLLPGAQVILLLAGAFLRMPALWLISLPWPLHGILIRLLPLPGKAFTLLDAACRALYRQFVSHRGLLTWVTAAQTEQGSGLPLSCVLAQVAVGAAMTALSLRPGGWWPGALIGMLWLAAPLLISWLDHSADAPRKLTPAMERDARSLARDTWQFFADSVTEKTLFLPPDNVQTEPDKGPAMRTSPTNIGLYLLSCCAAREMGLISSAEMARRAYETLSTLERLDAWRGHFYNWYDLNTGAPLPPRFVSTVDSGNLAGCLLCCAQIFRNHLQELEEEYHALPARLDALAARMDFSALYDKKRHLFFIGWEAEQNRPTPAHYDCLASEARLTSFIAVMTGQIERCHWRYLNRTAVRAGGGIALLSWGGTLFEYLMPNLLLPLTPGTLLGEGCKNAVRAQMADDPSRPFGISESGCYAFDPDLNYQYRAFGLPILARSGETAGQVIAPYASLLALPFFPRAVGENLRRMEERGWRDHHGLFEAADYTNAREDHGPRIVKSHMAHHQGMILCALCNALENNALVRAFMTPAAPRAYAYLLLERAPGTARRRSALPPPRAEKSAWSWPPRRAFTGLPEDACILHGRDTVWLLNAQGQGYLAHQETMITRFRAQAGEQTGPQCYVRDPASGAFFRPMAEGAAVYRPGEADFSASFQGLQVTLRCCVDPLLDMAVMKIEMENPGAEETEMEIISFLEIAQSAQAADAAHPNFRDLSVRVTPLGPHGLLSRRLPREENEKPPLVAHGAAGDVFALRRQGDRTLFLGRSGSYAAPDQASLAAEDCVFRTGDVGAPCLSLRVKTRVPAEGKARVYFYTMPGESEEKINAVLPAPSRIQAAFSLAATHAAMTARFLRLDTAAIPLYQHLLGALAFYDQPHQAALLPAPRNALWKAGISGDLPLLLVDLSEGPDAALIRRALQAHAWLSVQGFRFDLAFFCPPENEYQRPCQDQVTAAFNAGPDRSPLGAPGGVLITSGSETEKTAMASLARLTLRGGRSLKNQLLFVRSQPKNRAEGAWRLPAPAPSGSLILDNPFGGFTAEGGYCVKLSAPVPWHQLLAGPAFGTLVCESGILQSWFGNSRLGRITRPSPDVYRGVPGEEIILQCENGVFYPLARCAVQYEPGMAVYSVQAGEISAETAVFSHAERGMGVRSVTLRGGGKPQRVALYYLVRFALGEAPEASRCRAVNEFVFARNGDMPGLAWAAMNGARCQSLSGASAFGMIGSLPPPALSQTAQGMGSVGLLICDAEIRPRETARFTLALGAAAHEEEARRDFAALLSEGAAAAARSTRASWSRLLSRMTLFSFDPGLNVMMNTWLPYQVRAARLLARLGPYQASGAIGFRDQLQDCLALLHTEPQAVRTHLLLCAAHQFPEGDVQHWWHAPARGVRTRVSDDKLFLPYITAQYVKVTGDESILSEEAPYLLSSPLAETEDERYEQPEESAIRESLYLHCLRALDSVRTGPHGLPLMGSGDWNDGLNRIGGESVWLGFFYAITLKAFAALCPPEQKEKYMACRRKLLDSAESAWTGQWYLRAWRSSGEPLGGPDTHPPRMDLISQCFAVLAGAPRDHARAALLRAVEWLYDREAGLVRLLDPPFSPEENAGYIGGYLPGMRENGGQYTHAVPWLILALCRVGEYALAWEIAQAILPLNHTGTKEKTLVYRAEPYVLCGDVYEGENRGRGGWSWYTGSAAWLYWTVLTALLGFEKQGDRARLLPCPAPDAEEFTLVYRFGTANYHFTAARDTIFPTLDGEKLQDGWAPLLSDGKTHEARFPMRN